MLDVLDKLEGQVVEEESEGLGSMMVWKGIQVSQCEYLGIELINDFLEHLPSIKEE